MQSFNNKTRFYNDVIALNEMKLNYKSYIEANRLLSEAYEIGTQKAFENAEKMISNLQLKENRK